MDATVSEKTLIIVSKELIVNNISSFEKSYKVVQVESSSWNEVRKMKVTYQVAPLLQ